MSSTSSPASRQAFPDQLRGLALLGIIVVNAPFLGISSNGYTAASIASPIDWAAAFSITFLAQGKFYLIFSFLFGYSANFIIGSTGATGRRRFRRRLLGLGVIGLVHAVFLFVGDILLSYALLGSALLLLVSRPDRTVLRTSVVTGVIAAGWLGALILLAWASPGDLGPDPAATQLDAALATGSFVEAAVARAQALPTVLLLVGTLQWGMAFSAFCLGLVAGRRSVLRHLAVRVTLWRRLAIWGLGIGLPVQAFAAWLALGAGVADGSASGEVIGVALGFLTAPVLAAGYVGALALLSVRHPSALGAVQDSGRASLTLYIGESLVLSVLFCGYGFGLFATLGAAAVAGIAVLVWAGLEVGIRLWLGRYRQGPLEGLLSRWTNTTARTGAQRPPSLAGPAPGATGGSPSHLGSARSGQ